MKKIYLALLPVLAVSACGAKTIDREKAKEIALAVDQETINNVKNFQISSSSNSTETKDGKKITYTSKATYKQNEKSEWYLKSESKSDGVTTYTEIWHVFNDEYEEVYFAKTKEGDKEEKKSALVKKDNEVAFAIGATVYGMTGGVYSFVFATYSMPGSSFFGEEAQSDEKYDISYSYTSSNDKSLTIKVTETLKKDVKVENETMKKQSVTISYSNLHFASYSTSATSTEGNTSKSSISGKVFSSLTISLPSGWAEYIGK